MAKLIDKYNNIFCVRYFKIEKTYKLITKNTIRQFFTLKLEYILKDIIYIYYPKQLDIRVIVIYSIPEYLHISRKTYLQILK